MFIVEKYRNTCEKLKVKTTSLNVNTLMINDITYSYFILTISIIFQHYRLIGEWKVPTWRLCYADLRSIFIRAAL